MKELLKEENCFIYERVKDFKEAIHLSCIPLIEQGYCSEEYEESILENTLKYGPYYVLCENLALIHASNTKGVKETQISVLLLKEAVRFKEDGWDVKVVILLVAKDCLSHLKALQTISYIFSNKERIDKLLLCESSQNVFEYFINSNNQMNESNYI